MAPIPVAVPIILSLLWTTPIGRRYSEIFFSETTANAPATFSCGKIRAFFAELQQTTAELQQKNSLTNHVKIYGNQTKNEKVYWKKIVEADGTITIGSTQNAAEATVFVIKAETGDLYEGGRFNIELHEGSEKLLLEAVTATGKENNPCVTTKFVAKSADSSRAIERFQPSTDEGSGEVPEQPTQFILYSSYPIFGIVTSNYCAFKPDQCTQ